MHASYLFGVALVGIANAHTVAWAKGMYCFGGNNTHYDDPNTNLAVNPLFNLTKKDWWFQHDRGCDKAPPAKGEFLELPARKSFTVELAHNRAQTTFSYNGAGTSAWPDGQKHPNNWNDPNCIQNDGAMHTQNQSMAAGTAFAISYESDLSKVTMENLVIFTVLKHTPWKRIATYEVPDLPACPPGGCHCAWLWVPNGCGTPNMYMAGYKCKVTGATSRRRLARPKAPVYCGTEATVQRKCVKGAKQMVAWNQHTGNNVVTDPSWLSPGYNEKMGFKNGAQHDIFRRRNLSK